MNKFGSKEKKKCNINSNDINIISESNSNYSENSDQLVERIEQIFTDDCDKSLVCSFDGCLKKFKNKSYLKEHQLIHHQEKRIHLFGTQL